MSAPIANRGERGIEFCYCCRQLDTEFFIFETTAAAAVAEVESFQHYQELA